MAKSHNDGVELYPGSPVSVVACRVVRYLHEGDHDSARDPSRERRGHCNQQADFALNSRQFAGRQVLIARLQDGASRTRTNNVIPDNERWLTSRRQWLNWRGVPSRIDSVVGLTDRGGTQSKPILLALDSSEVIWSLRGKIEAPEPKNGCLSAIAFEVQQTEIP